MCILIALPDVSSEKCEKANNTRFIQLNWKHFVCGTKNSHFFLCWKRIMNFMHNNVKSMDVCACEYEANKTNAMNQLQTLGYRVLQMNITSMTLTVCLTFWSCASSPFSNKFWQFAMLKPDKQNQWDGTRCVVVWNTHVHKISIVCQWNMSNIICSPASSANV